MHTPPDKAPIPPSNEVPTPKGTIGILLSEHNNTISLISSVVSGKITPSGGATG